MKKYKVLIIDDSAIVRQVLTQIISSDPELEVIGTAHDPLLAAKKITNEKPDVITLDINMPRMDGLTFLKHLMYQNPIQVVIISGYTEQDALLAFQALEYGAIEVINKPVSTDFNEISIRICDAIKAAANAKIIKKYKKPVLENKIFKSKNKFNHTEKNIYILNSDYHLIAIGASTGGTEAIQYILENLDTKIPGIVIVQHMPENFTKSFAKRLNNLCKLNVKEAENGDVITPGQVLIAPGNKHMLVKQANSSNNPYEFYVEITNGPLVNRHRPSVDVLFKSVAEELKSKAIGIILTGMGNDGARGILEMKEKGALTIAQDKESSVVFVMPNEAIKIGEIDIILPLSQIPSFINKTVKNTQSKNSQ